MHKAVLLAECCASLVVASGEIVPTLIPAESRAPRLACQREELSKRQLQRAQYEAGSDEGDRSLAWRHLEASYALDRGNVEARRQILAHHLDAALTYDSSTKVGQDWTWRVDNELDAALTTVQQRVGTTADAAELEEFNELAQQFNYRKRRRQREHVGQQKLQELRREQQQATTGTQSHWRALFASMVLQRPIYGADRPWSNDALVKAALEGLRLSRLPEGATRQVYAEGTPKATVSNNEFFAWQMEVLRNTSRCWSGFSDLKGWSSLEAEMRLAAADLLVGHGMPEAEARRRAVLAPLVTWASVHSAGSSHPAHIHADSTVSGVYYARVPEGSGGIEFVDPRGVTALVQGPKGESELPKPPFTHGMAVDVSEGELVVFPGYLPHSVEVMVAPLEHGQSSSSRVSISFNLLGGWEPPLTTLGMTWSTTMTTPTDSASQVKLSSDRTCNTRSQEDKNDGTATSIFDGGLIVQLCRLMLWSACHHFLMQRGHGAGLFFAAGAIALTVEYHCMHLWPAAFGGTSNMQETHLRCDSVEDMRSSDASELDLGSLPLDCRFGLTSSGIECAVNGSIFEGFTSADLRDPDALLKLSGPLEQQLVQYYSDRGHESVDASQIAAQTGDFKKGIGDGRFSNLPVYVLQSTSVVQIHIT